MSRTPTLFRQEECRVCHIFDLPRSRAPYTRCPGTIGHFPRCRIRLYVQAKRLCRSLQHLSAHRCALSTEQLRPDWRNGRAHADGCYRVGAKRGQDGRGSPGRSPPPLLPLLPPSLPLSLPHPSDPRSIPAFTSPSLPPFLFLSFLPASLLAASRLHRPTPVKLLTAGKMDQVHLRAAQCPVQCRQV